VLVASLIETGKVFQMYSILRYSILFY